MQRKDIKEIILDYLRSNCNAPISAEDLLEALASECSATKFWNELLALEKYGRIVKTRFVFGQHFPRWRCWRWLFKVQP